MMQNEPWVWLKVGGAGTSGAGAVPLRSAQMMGQQNKQTKQTKTTFVSLCCFLMAHICCCLQQAQQMWQCIFHFCCFLMSHVTVSNNARFTLLIFDVSCFFVYSKPNKGVFVAFNKVVMAWAPNWHLFARVDCSAGWTKRAQVCLTITLWVGDRCWWRTSLGLCFLYEMKIRLKTNLCLTPGWMFVCCA